MWLKIMDDKKDFVVKKEEEKERLVILIDHWIRHNREHTSEYLKVAEKLESQGLSEIASSIRKASVLVLQVNGSLSSARNTLAQYKNEADQAEKLE